MPWAQLFQKIADNYNMDPLTLTLGVLALIGLAGCGKPEKKEEAENCLEPKDFPPPKPAEGEELYQEGGHYALIDDRLGEETAKFYLNILPQQAQKILDLFGIDSPWKKSLRINLIRLDSENNICRDGSVACATRGNIIFPHSELDMSVVREEASRGNIAGEGVFVHEMSHALRSGIAHLEYGLEEGLANYTASNLVPRNTTYQPRSHAQRIYEGNLLAGETVSFPDEINIEKMTLVSFDEFSAELTFDKRRIRPQSSRQETLVIPFNSYWHSNGHDFIFYVEKNSSSEPGLMVKVFQRGRLHFEDGDSSGFALADIISSNIRCAEEGYYEIQMIMTDEGPITVVDDNLFHYAQTYRNSGTCFWDRIRENYGHSAVMAIVQSMVEFFREHSSLPANTEFPFFQTFLDVTGMDKKNARAYFDLYSIPIEDSWYRGGGICWDE